MWGSIAAGLAGLVGLVNSQKANRDANRLQTSALSVTDRQLEMAEQAAQRSEAWRQKMAKWYEDQAAEGAYSADAQIEAGMQDIADFERRGLSAVRSDRYARGMREGDSVVDENTDRVAIDARRELGKLRAMLKAQARAEELQTLGALSPDPALAGIYQNNAAMAGNARINLSNAVRAQAGNPASFLAGLMPLLQGKTGGGA
ncbi:MAG TPA: hypothetical protein PLS15_12690 [Fimbriimonadaceae bacterium]|nr:hypothetical protein [Fimbriimonadaceae bacterium]